jgi:hypothetical protein
LINCETKQGGEAEWKCCTEASVKISEENIKVEQQVKEKEMTLLPVAVPLSSHHRHLQSFMRFNTSCASPDLFSPHITSGLPCLSLTSCNLFRKTHHRYRKTGAFFYDKN